MCPLTVGLGNRLAHSADDLVRPPHWNWVVAATVLLGVNQGLTWSMTQTSKLDITRLEERGLTLGLNEFAGYVGVALAGILTAYLATRLGTRQGLLIFGLCVITLALLLTHLWVNDTLPWAKAEAIKHAPGTVQTLRPGYPEGVSSNPSTWEIFTLISWRDKRLMAFCQAGLVEKFVDALVWVWPCCIRISLPPWQIFRTQPGAAPPLASTASGATWVTALARSAWAQQPPGAAGSRAHSGLSR